MVELVERTDGLFDFIYGGVPYREACALSNAFAFSRPYALRGDTWLVLGGTTRINIA